MIDRAKYIRARLTDARGLVEALGLKVARGANARQAMIVCPAHPDRTPSCSVRVAKADGTISVRCHACGWSADALGLIAKVRDVDDFREVLRVAAEIANAPGLAPPVEASRTEPTSDVPSHEEYDGIWSFVLERCSPLRGVAPAVAGYLRFRKIFPDAEAAGLRGLPRDGRELVATLLSNFERGKLEHAGVLRPGVDALDAATWPLLVPWRDRFGRITCVQRRRIDDGRPKYLTAKGRSPRAPFGVEILPAALDFLGPEAEVIFCEGALDALARRRIARSNGERSAVLGVYSASSPAVGLPLDLLRGRRIVLALDNDGAGDAACEKLGAALVDVAGSLVRERVEGGKDWLEALSGDRGAA